MIFSEVAQVARRVTDESGPKVLTVKAAWYLIAADPSTIPVVAAVLEATPRNAKGVAIFEVTSLEDRQDIDIPEGVDVHWLVQPDPLPLLAPKTV